MTLKIWRFANKISCKAIVATKTIIPERSITGIQRYQTPFALEIERMDPLEKFS